MRNALFAGASAVALVLGGCSMFHSNDNGANASGTNYQTPAAQAPGGDGNSGTPLYPAPPNATMPQNATQRGRSEPGE